MSEVQLTKLTWEDPIKDIASRVAIPVRIFSLDASPTSLWGLTTPISVPANGTTTIVARVQPGLGIGNIVGIESWEAVTSGDYEANSIADGSGSDYTSRLSVVLVGSGLSATLALSNSGNVPLFVISLTLSGTALRVALEYDSEHIDPTALATFNDRPYVVRSKFIAADAVDTFATRIFLAFAIPAARGVLTYIRDDFKRPPDLSDLIGMRTEAGTRIYYCEQLVHKWTRGSRHEIRMIINQVDVLPDAVAPMVTINTVPLGVIFTSVELGAMVEGGAYDVGPTYAWTVSGGSLDDAASATPTWTRPATGGQYEISLTVSVEGSGLLARSGSTDSVTASVDVSVLALPAASAPTVTIGSIPDGEEGATVELGVTLVGGAYDLITYAWTVTGGSLAGAATATPTWTRPLVDSDDDYTISLTVSVSGDDILARAGTSDTAMDSETVGVTR